LDWVRGEVSSFGSLMQTYSDYCAMAGAKATATVALEANGCTDVSKIAKPGSPLPIAEGVMSSSNDCELASRQIGTKIWNRGLRDKTVELISDRLKMFSFFF